MATATGRVSVTKVTIRGVPRFRVNYSNCGRRVRQVFASKSAAEAEAARVRSEFVRFGGAWMALPVSERGRLMEAWERAKKNGVDLVSLASTSTQQMRPASLGAVVDELCAAKAAAGRAADYVRGLRLVLGQFVRGRESLPIGSVSLADVEGFLDSKSLAYRSTLRARLSTLFRFAVRRGFCSVNVCERLEAVTHVKPPPRVFSPSELRACLDWFRRHPRGMTWFVLTALCGLRPDEARKTPRSAIRCDCGFIVVDSQTTKVRERRVVLPLPCAMRWLRLSLDLGGECPLPAQFKRRLVRRLRGVLGWKAWPKDITRHTAASYWLAVRADAGFVAEQLGNSDRVLKRDYRALLTPEAVSGFREVFEGCCV